jgi:hypothetical protein
LINRSPAAKTAVVATSNQPKSQTASKKLSRIKTLGRIKSKRAPTKKKLNPRLKAEPLKSLPKKKKDVRRSKARMAEAV